MNTKLMAAAAAAAGILAMAGSADALEVINISSVLVYVAPAPGTLITDFNSMGGVATTGDKVGPGNPGPFLQGGAIVDLAPGFTFTQDHGAYTRDGGAGLDSGVSAPPPVDNGTPGAYYETVLNGGSATLTSLRGLTSFSFYMGSPDEYNGLTLTFYGVAGEVVTETGNQIWGGHPPGEGVQTVGYTVTYTFSPEAVKTIKFTSTGNSFEFDRLAGVAVPEPATWAMMVLGFGLAGGMARAQRRRAAAA